MREARWAPRSADDEFLADVERHVARVQQDATRAIARCRGATSRTRRICALATFVVWSLAFVGLSAPRTTTKISAAPPVRAREVVAPPLRVFAAANATAAAAEEHTLVDAIGRAEERTGSTTRSSSTRISRRSRRR